MPINEENVHPLWSPPHPPVYLDKFNKGFYFAVIVGTAQVGNLIENFIVGQILALFAYWRVMGLKNRQIFHIRHPTATTDWAGIELIVYIIFLFFKSVNPVSAYMYWCRPSLMLQFFGVFFIDRIDVKETSWGIENKANLRNLKLRLAYSLETLNLGQNRWCFVPCDLEIWWMTLENNRASFLCCFKLCATFRSHRWIQTVVTVRKRPIWVKFDNF